MKKILVIALTVFLSVVAYAQNFDNGCVYSPTHGTTIEAVQLDAYQADALPVEMNVVLYEMPLVDCYSQLVAVVYCDFQSLAITYADTGETVSYAMWQNSFTYFNDNTAAHRHRTSDTMIRQVQAA